MKKAIFNTTLVIVFSISLLGAAGSASAQIDRTPKKRLISQVAVKGYVGGEAHKSYVIRAKKGQTMIVEISWLRRNNNRAEIKVSKSANFYTGGAVNFGSESNGRKRWRGKIPKTGDHYIYVVAHPTADYTLRATVQ